MSHFPENLVRLHEHEEKIRTQSVATIEGASDLTLHIDVLEAAVSAIRHYVVRDEHLDEDDLTVRLLGIRIANALTAALQQLLSGYYQNSALIQRDLVETGFLIEYFSIDRAKVATWRTGSERERKRDFSPIAVRKALDAHHKHEGEKRAEGYRLFSQLAGHPHPKGFAMLRDSSGLHQFGPFFDPTALAATLSELAKHSLAAGESFQHIFTRTTRQDYEVQFHLFVAMGKWLEKFWNRPFDKAQAERLRATIARMPM